MKKTVVLAAALFALSTPAFAQSTMSPAGSGANSDAPASTNQPMKSGMSKNGMSEGRAAAPNAPLGQTAPNGASSDKQKSGANGG